jgi:hypothetical protein
MQHQGKIIGKQEPNDKKNACGDREYQDSLPYKLIVSKIKQVRKSVRSNEKQDNRKPKGGHQHRAGIHEMTIEDLNKQKRSYTEINSKSYKEGEFLGDIPTEYYRRITTAYLRDKSNYGTSGHNVHRDHVEEKGDSKQYLKP